MYIITREAFYCHKDICNVLNVSMKDEELQPTGCTQNLQHLSKTTESLRRLSPCASGIWSQLQSLSTDLFITTSQLCLLCTAIVFLTKVTAQWVRRSTKPHLLLPRQPQVSGAKSTRNKILIISTLIKKNKAFSFLYLYVHKEEKLKN